MRQYIISCLRYSTSILLADIPSVINAAFFQLKASEVGLFSRYRLRQIQGFRWEGALWPGPAVPSGSGGVPFGPGAPFLNVCPIRGMPNCAEESPTLVSSGEGTVPGGKAAPGGPMGAAAPFPPGSANGLIHITLKH